MIGFTHLEQAALRAIFEETPELTAGLTKQLEVAVATKRENSGAGFFTTIQVSDRAETLESPRVLGQVTYALVQGLTYGLGFVLFMKDGRLHLLEGYSCGGEDTTNLSLNDLTFRIANTPFDTY